MRSRRVTLLASEILGMPGTGGAATADSLLAAGLGRHGHHVELLVAPGRPPSDLSEEWTALYRSAGVVVRRVESQARVRPAFLGPPVAMLEALREEQPDVVITDDWRGLGYAALRSRQLGLGLDETAFVVLCHGPARILAEFAGKVPDTLARFGEQVAERTSISLADAVVTPTRWLHRWMREHDWPVPESPTVIPYVTESTALETTAPQAPTGSPIRRLAFFGQLREGKGIRIFLESLDALEPRLLAGLELLFLGRETPRWTTARITTSLSPAVTAALGAIRFETGLERSAALAELTSAGTLAVMPSLLDNAPNTVTECLERGVPFISTRTGGIPELVADEAHTRVLCEPRSDDLAAALTRALDQPGFAPAQRAGDQVRSLDRWLELVDSIEPPTPRRARAAARVAILSTSAESAARAERLAAESRSVNVEVFTAATREDALGETSAEWILFLDDEDLPDGTMVDALVAAQAASGADVVTAAVRRQEEPEVVQVFLGCPGALGLVENHYGVLGLVRRSLVVVPPSEDASDPDWLLFARLTLAGARVVSIPEPLATNSGRIGRIGDVPGDGLAILRAFEVARGEEMRDLPQLTATLAAAHARATEPAPPPSTAAHALVMRGVRALRSARGGRVTRRMRQGRDQGSA